MTEWIIDCHDCDGPRFEPERFDEAVRIKGAHVARTKHDVEIRRREA